MTSVITLLGSPVDNICLIHKALRDHGAMVAGAAERAGADSSIQAFRCAFDSWASGLLYFFEHEHVLMSQVLSESEEPGGGSNDQIWAVGLAHDVRREMVEANGREQMELTGMMEEVLTVLNEEIQRTNLIQRTKRHLCQRVLSLRLALDDHLDDFETFVLPFLRRTMSEARQREVVRRLLNDEESSDPRWVMNWVAQTLAPDERLLLERLEAGAASAA